MITSRPTISSIAPTFAQAEGLGKPAAAVGVERSMGPRAADGDLGGAGIDGVGAEALHVGHHALGGCALRGVDGLVLPRPHMPISEVAQIEPLALPVLLALDQHGAAGQAWLV